MALSGETPPKSSSLALICKRLAWRDSLLLRQRMQIAHQTFQPLLDDMGVDLRRRNIGMAEQCLHDAQVGAVVQKVACKSMPQHVWRDQPRREARGGREFFQVARKMLPGQVAALAEGRKQPFRAGRIFRL